MSAVSDPEDSNTDFEKWMMLAIELAENGRGWVEPNPMVGCMIVKDHKVIGSGYHEKFGGHHAEVNAIKNCDVDPRGSTVFVSLEPCCHTGKTPPCTQALIDANVARVIIGMRDPFPKVNGGGIRKLVDAGIEVSVGLLEGKIKKQNAGFLKRIRENRPWVIAKWAMTLDGRIATHAGNSQWISNTKSRAIVHRIRSQVDAVIVGSGTALTDDPMLNARLDCQVPRIASRIVFDSEAKIPLQSKLCQSANQIPVILVVDPQKAQSTKLNQFREIGVEVYETSIGYGNRVGVVLNELANREMTNVLVEGGAKLMGEFLDAQSIDEVNVFIAPKLIGSGISPIESKERLTISDGILLNDQSIETLDDNILIRGLIDPGHRDK